MSGHKFKIKIGRTARECSVELDGSPLEGVVGVRAVAQVGDMPILVLEVRPANLEIEGDCDAEQVNITQKVGP